MTPAIRLLQREGVSFTEHPYVHQADAESYGEEAASALGVAPAQVFKTLICQADDGRLVMVLLPSSQRLHLKSLARHLGVKKVDLADPAVAERTTGYVIGGISPLGGRKRLPTVIDSSLATWDKVFISAGRRGLQLQLASEELRRLTGADLAAITEPG